MNTKNTWLMRSLRTGNKLILEENKFYPRSLMTGLNTILPAKRKLNPLKISLGLVTIAMVFLVAPLTLANQHLPIYLINKYQMGVENKNRLVRTYCTSKMRSENLKLEK